MAVLKKQKDVEAGLLLCPGLPHPSWRSEVDFGGVSKPHLRVGDVFVIVIVIVTVWVRKISQYWLILQFSIMNDNKGCPARRHAQNREKTIHKLHAFHYQKIYWDLGF